MTHCCLFAAFPRRRACPNCESPVILDHNSFGWWLRCPDYASGYTGKHELGKASSHVIERLIVGS